MPTILPTLALLLLLAPAAADNTSAAAITWESFFANVRVEGLTFSERLKALECQRVQLRGYAVSYPEIPGGLFLSRFPHLDPHGVEEHDLPFDSVAVLWKQGVELPPVPSRPTVEGVLRLGNRRFGDDVVVTITIEDAVPVYREAAEP